jgi:hypothetical protein
MELVLVIFVALSALFAVLAAYIFAQRTKRLMRGALSQQQKKPGKRWSPEL